MELGLVGMCDKFDTEESNAWSMWSQTGGDCDSKYGGNKSADEGGEVVVVEDRVVIPFVEVKAWAEEEDDGKEEFRRNFRRPSLITFFLLNRNSCSSWHRERSKRILVS